MQLGSYRTVETLYLMALIQVCLQNLILGHYHQISRREGRHHRYSYLSPPGTDQLFHGRFRRFRWRKLRHFPVGFLWRQCTFEYHRSRKYICITDLAGVGSHHLLCAYSQKSASSRPLLDQWPAVHQFWTGCHGGPQSLEVLFSWAYSSCL